VEQMMVQLLGELLEEQMLVELLGGLILVIY
jgi:hypothetical protein